jgi:hypothetical protein
MNDGSNTTPGPSPDSMPRDYPDVEVKDGGLLKGGRERAWVLPCGNTIACSDKLLTESRDDVMMSLQRLANRHMWLHERDSTGCGTAMWEDNEGKTRTSAEVLAS